MVDAANHTSCCTAQPLSWPQRLRRLATFFGGTLPPRVIVVSSHGTPDDGPTSEKQGTVVAPQA